MNDLNSIPGLEQNSQLLDGLMQLMPMLLISTGAISLLLIIFFVSSVISKISNHRRTKKMQNDITVIKELLEKISSRLDALGNHSSIAPTTPEIKLADGAIQQPSNEEITT